MGPQLQFSTMLPTVRLPQIPGGHPGIIFERVPPNIPAFFSTHFGTRPVKPVPPGETEFISRPADDDVVLAKTLELHTMFPEFTSSIASAPSTWFDLFQYFDPYEIWVEGAAFLFFVIQQIVVQNRAKEYELSMAADEWISQNLHMLAHRLETGVDIVGPLKLNECFDLTDVRPHEIKQLQGIFSHQLRLAEARLIKSAGIDPALHYHSSSRRFEPAEALRIPPRPQHQSIVQGRRTNSHGHNDDFIERRNAGAEFEHRRYPNDRRDHDINGKANGSHQQGGHPYYSSEYQYPRPYPPSQFEAASQQPSGSNFVRQPRTSVSYPNQNGSRQSSGMHSLPGRFVSQGARNHQSSCPTIPRKQYSDDARVARDGSSRTSSSGAASSGNQRDHYNPRLPIENSVYVTWPRDRTEDLDRVEKLLSTCGKLKRWDYRGAHGFAHFENPESALEAIQRFGDFASNGGKILVAKRRHPTGSMRSDKHFNIWTSESCRSNNRCSEEISPQGSELDIPSIRMRHHRYEQRQDIDNSTKEQFPSLSQLTAKEGNNHSPRDRLSTGKKGGRQTPKIKTDSSVAFPSSASQSHSGNRNTPKSHRKGSNTHSGTLKRKNKGNRASDEQVTPTPTPKKILSSHNFQLGHSLEQAPADPSFSSYTTSPSGDIGLASSASTSTVNGLLADIYVSPRHNGESWTSPCYPTTVTPACEFLHHLSLESEIPSASYSQSILDVVKIPKSKKKKGKEKENARIIKSRIPNANNGPADIVTSHNASFASDDSGAVQSKGYNTCGAALVGKRDNSEDKYLEKSSKEEFDPKLVSPALDAKSDEADDALKTVSPKFTRTPTQTPVKQAGGSSIKSGSSVIKADNARTNKSFRKTPQSRKSSLKAASDVKVLPIDKSTDRKENNYSEKPTLYLDLADPDDFPPLGQSKIPRKPFAWRRKPFADMIKPPSGNPLQPELSSSELSIQTSQTTAGEQITKNEPAKNDSSISSSQTDSCKDWPTVRSWI